MLRFLLAGLLVYTALPATAQPFDLLLTGAHVVDGSGRAPYAADVALRDGRIAAVGDLSGFAAADTLDLTGLVLAPGFIDAHSHAAEGLVSAELAHAEPLLRQGITTVVVNPDGGGPVDLAAQRTALEAHGPGVHVAPLIGHGSVRHAVLGLADRAPTPEEQAAMAALVRTAMDDGAFGVSSGLYYTPGHFADTDELVTLARVVAAYGGVHTSHIRDESNYSIGVLAAVEEIIEISRRSGVTGVVTHIKALGPPVWGQSAAIIRAIDQARREGLSVWADQYPYHASATSLGAALIPQWARADGRDAFRRRLAHADTLALIRDAMTANLARRGGADRLQFRFVTHDPALEGQTLHDAANATGTDAVTRAIDLEIAGGAGIVSFNMDDTDIAALMRQPWTMTASDGGLTPFGHGVPHPRNYGTFPRRLRTYVYQQAVTSLPTAIRSMTALPAQVYGLTDRGRLRPGAWADLVAFDPEAIRDRATFTDPHQYAEGIVHVWLEGQWTLRDGTLQPKRHGRVLRRRAP